MKAGDIMSTDLATVNDTASISMTEALAAALHVRHMPIKNEAGNLIGLVSSRDILKYLSKRQQGPSLSVKEIMSSDLETVSSDDDLKAVARLMLDKNISCVPVVDDELIVGVISERDFMRFFAEGS
jgi:CBS domain-containing protein